MQEEIREYKTDYDPIKKIMIEYELLINKKLYETEIISLEVYEKMSNKLLNKVKSLTEKKQLNVKS